MMLAMGRRARRSCCARAVSEGAKDSRRALRDIAAASRSARTQGRHAIAVCGRNVTYAHLQLGDPQPRLTPPCPLPSVDPRSAARTSPLSPIERCQVRSASSQQYCGVSPQRDHVSITSPRFPRYATRESMSPGLRGWIDRLHSTEAPDASRVGPLFLVAPR